MCNSIFKFCDCYLFSIKDQVMSKTDISCAHQFQQLGMQIFKPFRRMETETLKSNQGNLDSPLQIQQGRGIFGANGASFITFVFVFGILLQVYGKMGRKSLKKLTGKEGEKYVGLEVLPKIKPLPFLGNNKWIGIIPQLLPINSTNSIW